MSKTLMRELRERNNIPQNKMLLGVDRSQYSRIETGKAELNFKTLNKICDRFGLTLKEYIALDDSTNHIDELLTEFRDCSRHMNNTEKKEQFLDRVTPLLNTPKIKLTRIEINFLFAIRSIMSTYWKEIPELTQEEKQEILDYLVNSKFYSQYDYMLALNTLKHYDTKEIVQVINKMSPLEFFDKRNELTKQYSHLLLTNAITAFIYDQEYNLALEYVEKAHSFIELKDSYYLHLTLLYLKNLSLSFIKNNTKYIEKTRAVIRIIHDIGDIALAKQLEDELDTLHHFPDYYKKRKQVVEMPAST